VSGDDTVLVTGGAGFIGSTLAIELKRAVPGRRVVALDSLRRRGSELNLPRLQDAGAEFEHGDVRQAEDVIRHGRDARLIIDCSAEPSVLAGYDGSPTDVVDSNLLGTINCLELARRNKADVVFLSTSRVYPIAAVNAVAVVEEPTRFRIAPGQQTAGLSTEGIAESFPLEGARSLYGATKLASELLLQEYGGMYGFRFVINRLGVVSGPGQMGRVEQGVFALWMARHYFGGGLEYRGWGGTGKQVRDVLHVQDVWGLVRRQITNMDAVNGRTYNAGGGAANSISLCEATQLCEELTGRTIPVRSVVDTHPADVRLYCTDNARVTRDIGWTPAHDLRAIFQDIYGWIRREEAQVRRIFGF